MLTLPFQVSSLSILTCSIKYKWESSHSRYIHSLARVSFSDHLSSVWFSVPYPMGGDNRDVAKIQRQRLHNHTQPISTKLCKRHSEVKGIQVCSFGFFSKELGPCYFPGEAILAIYIKTHLRHWKVQILTKLHIPHSCVNGMNGCSKENAKGR